VADDQLGKFLLVTELLVPDLHLETSFELDRPGLALSFPLAPWSNGFALGGQHFLGLVHFVEPQVRPGREAYRVAAGERLVLSRKGQFGLVVEAGGILGSDGRGGFVGIGGGVGYKTDDGAVQVLTGLVLRAVVTDQERRFDVMVDLLQFPWNSL
jgi:hypothetical protein